jgi:vacuolar protein sorting-associated protein 13A/C
MGTIGSGLSELTFDEDLVRERIKHKNIKAESFEMGVKMGLRELGSSLKSTITGLVEQPLEGHRRGGRVGAIKGTLFGLTGLVTKPISGIILAVAKTVEGLSASSSYLDYHRWLGR